MELIIKIPDELYKKLKTPRTVGLTEAFDQRATLIRAIANGTPYNPSGDCISRSALKEEIDGIVFHIHDRATLREMVLCKINNAPSVEITEEQAINKLHETGWLIGHDKEMTTRTQGDLISREALKTELEAYRHTRNYKSDEDEAQNNLLDNILEDIDNAQAIEYSLLPLSGEADKAYMRGYEVGKAEGILKAEPRPNEQIAWEQGYEAGLAQCKHERPQGEWINKRTIKHDGEFYCSNCDFELEDFIQGAFYNFCPNCGADMRKGDAE